MIDRATEAQSRDITSEYLAMADHWLRLALIVKEQSVDDPLGPTSPDDIN